ncbi:uncharacterized protein UV8b_05158 [Ustilaginoidea virens]|uniref:PA14 domain-containing protein n=1 Tax=Ustilaginoidea virens TaxID=1159556 RepID=A0A8E5MIT3_USTVR|nr:uncharacterized protein UV8b_05158 [Ustilaginoidea virens]QUC20917.1 hypothetical protein UV8b_05158 [Ustilaginoidea virens]
MPSGTVPGTVIIQILPSYVTLTQVLTGSGTAPVTLTVPPSGAVPGSVIVQTPPVTTPYVTVYQILSGTNTVVSTFTVPSNGTIPGSIVIQTPPSYITTTVPYPGTITSAVTTTVPPTGTTPGTVLVQTPAFSAGANCKIKPSCAPSGVSIYSYPNPWCSGFAFGTVSPSSYLTNALQPIASNVTNVTSIPMDTTYGTLPHTNDVCSSVYYYINYTRVLGGILVNGNNFTLVMEGFYRAPVSGSYSVCLTLVDDGEAVYIGEGSAFSCVNGQAFAAASPVLNVPWLTPSHGGCTTVSMTQGLFYPIRIVFGNAVGVGYGTLTIQPPGGVATRDFTGLLYPPSCGELL